MKGRYLKKKILASAFFVFMVYGSIFFAQAAEEAKEIARESRFIAYDNGTVLDMQTGLQWAAKDDGKGMDEQSAKAYFENYRGGGYADWRMPNVDELESIYDQHIQNKQGFHVTRLINISGEWVWCSEGLDSVTSFNFKDGSRPLAFFEGPGSGTWYSTEEPLPTANRALPVRHADHVEKMKKALPLLQEREIEIAVFPWRFIIKTSTSYADEKSATARSIEGLSQFLKEYKLVVPKFSYYDLGNSKNFKSKPLTKTIVKDIWIGKGIFSRGQVDLELIFRLGRQLEVDVVLVSSIYIEYRNQTADITLIDIKAKKAYSKMDNIYVKSLSSDIKGLIENSFIEYVNEKYKAHPNYEMILWEFIKNSQSKKSF